MGVKEKALTAASSIASGDFLRMVTSAGAARKIDYSKLAKAIVEEYNGSTIAGSAQTLKEALDSLNSKTTIITYYDANSDRTEQSNRLSALQTSYDALSEKNIVGCFYTRYSGGHYYPSLYIGDGHGPIIIEFTYTGINRWDVKSGTVEFGKLIVGS